MKSADSDSVEILFADDEEDSEESFPSLFPETRREKDVSRKEVKNVSRETSEEKTEKPDQVRQLSESDEKQEQENNSPKSRKSKGQDSKIQDNKNQDTKDPETKEQTEKSSDSFKNAVIVRISEVEPNREQPRKKFDDDKLEELSESIKTYGLLQPILVQKRDGYYEIIAGERRWRAALKAGLKEIPVIVRDYTEKEILELSLVENIQRENLNPIEEAIAYKRLMDEFGLGQEEVAQRVSKSRSAVANSLRLLKLEENVQKMVIDGEISMGHARALLPLEDPEQQLSAAKEIVDKKLSVRETEKKVKEILSSRDDTETKKPETKQQEEDPSIAIIYKQIEERLQQTLHTKVSIQRKRNGHGKLLIDFYNSDDLDKIIDKLTDH
ncbi:MAG: ParB/RepB/Spo0J family partition protein [Lachnospiraceae bacterium]|nr:ParB/RepB/Spo0J family partition protein [Lachnospiraceae bacterium]